jgi:hypothetical protein
MGKNRGQERCALREEERWGGGGVGAMHGGGAPDGRHGVGAAEAGAGRAMREQGRRRWRGPGGMGDYGPVDMGRPE